MDRRDTLLGLIALGTAPLAAFAQQPGKVWRVGFLSLPSRPVSIESENFGSFVRGMQELGYVEGRNLVIEWRFAGNDVGRLPGLAAELVRLNLDVIVSPGNDGPLALQRATTTLPIVTAAVSDPVSAGLAKSLARPGGNITGVSTLAGELGPKRFELLLEMVPRLSRVAYLLNPTSLAGRKALESARTVGEKRRVTILPVEARTVQEIDSAFSLAGSQNPDALIVSLNPVFQLERKRIAQLALKFRLPSMSADYQYAEAGCLMSYGASLTDSYRRAASYVDRILKGARPGDLPIEQPTRFELVINMKTATALGVKIPQTVLLRADDVIR